MNYIDYELPFIVLGLFMKLMIFFFLIFFFLIRQPSSKLFFILFSQVELCSTNSFFNRPTFEQTFLGNNVYHVLGLFCPDCKSFTSDVAFHLLVDVLNEQFS